MNRLGSLVLAQRDPDAIVAQKRVSIGDGVQFTRWNEFQRDVAGLSERINAQPEGPWVLLTEDAYAFAVGLFGLWHSGRHALSPPNHQPESLRDLQTRASGVLTDRPDWFRKGGTQHPLRDLDPGDPNLLRPLNRDAIALELYTSGTTGDGKAVTKRISHLEDEIAELQEVWDPRLGNATVFSTASHQHLYSLAIGLLWPLCSGRPFERHHYLHAAELVPPMRESNNCVLVSVPTHLKRFVRHSQSEELKGLCREVFSSGGPLPQKTAHDSAALLGASPIEIFGSTETGIVAWRRQEIEGTDDLWTPMPSVQIRRQEESGAIRIGSPFVSIDSGDEGFSTGDRIEIHEGNRFVLLPRLDRVVKIGEKRLDLGRMESDLRAHPWIEDVALGALEREGELRVIAAVVASETAQLWISETGHAGLTRAIREHLADAWDPVLHPRLWRIVDQLPENSQGKITRSELLALFENSPADSSKTRSDRPNVIDHSCGDAFIERACVVPRDLACFSGHFPGYPVVPAVLQLDWVMEMVSELLGQPAGLAGLPTLKFLEPLEPGQAFHVRVERMGPGEFQCRLWNEGRVFARGRLHVDAGDPT